jgi:GDP-L-fucose synthase
MSFWKNKKVVVTGGAGFAGSHLVDLLLGYGANVTVADIGSPEFPKNLAAVKDEIEFISVDLMTAEGARTACRGQEAVFNLAARTGSIKYNLEHPGIVLRDNTLMSLNMLEAARLEEAERFLCVSSACVYSRDAAVPTPETAGFIGDPEPANFGYGWAKRFAEIQSRTYADEYGMKIAIARPYNAYGPRDHFDPAVSHVIAAIIKRAVDGENPVTVWGDGEQLRTFLHVKDFARGLALACEKYAVCDPVNIGSDESILIKDLARMIIDLSGSGAELVFDTSKPGGLPWRTSDTAKAKEKLGYTAGISLRDGIAETIDWYREFC